ncbi:MAG: quinone-dependent dihydroorotate dehydrogenase [Sphingomonas sp.]|uniref:quinone-dependent dihydroorotate dehydrogenase n=1 Tax=Sphingomonas sp. TaxID=28214 RepID=UPI001855F216|nr:quinone-dependent dihydroorotate dehydrogenase [Sphingomonas sp.]MBA3666866.1 quinone-dependent dihydroorotate dehydrogenase [Sphingomonas sp.]
MALYPLLRPLMFAFDSEAAHWLTIRALSVMPRSSLPEFPPELASEVAGLRFPSPVGLAAGFDKDAEVPDAMLGLGFGFVEVGTLTPRPQTGNPKPRLFRLALDRAVINRLGFNNGGQAAVLERLGKRERRGLVGVNIGANKDSADRIADYAAGLRTMSPVADYLTINISSPNTPGLRDLQASGELNELLAAVREARSGAIPIFLKVAPDLEAGDHQRIVRAAIDHDIDALIVANTTVSRPLLLSHHTEEAGGLSGRPMKTLALEQLRAFRAETGGELPLIAVGGIESSDDAWARIVAGANLIQLYSALVYEGPGLAKRIGKGLAQRLRDSGFASLSQAVGSAA